MWTRGLRPIWANTEDGQGGSSGGTPAGEPAVSDPVAPEGGDSNEIDWGSVVDGGLEGPASTKSVAQEPAPAEPTPPNSGQEPAPAPEPAPADPSAAVEPPAEPAPTEPPAEPTPQDPTAPAEPEPPADPQTPEQQMATMTPEQYAENRKSYIDQVAQSYQISEEDVELLHSNPEQVLPRLAAEVQAQTVEVVMQAVAQHLPQSVQNIIRETTEHTKHENDFFEAWPDLNKPEYAQQLSMIGQVYRQTNPTATKADFIKNVGMQAWVALGLPMEKLLEQGGGSVQTPTAPSVTPSAPPPPTGYSPAGTVAAAPPPVPQAPQGDVQEQFFASVVEDI